MTSSELDAEIYRVDLQLTELRKSVPSLPSHDAMLAMTKAKTSEHDAIFSRRSEVRMLVSELSRHLMRLYRLSDKLARKSANRAKGSIK